VLRENLVKGAFLMNFFILLSALLLSVQVHGLEMTTKQPAVGAVQFNKSPAQQVLNDSLLNKILACNAKKMFYVPSDPTADADGCVAIDSGDITIYDTDIITDISNTYVETDIGSPLFSKFVSYDNHTTYNAVIKEWIMRTRPSSSWDRWFKRCLWPNGNGAGTDLVSNPLAYEKCGVPICQKETGKHPVMSQVGGYCSKGGSCNGGKFLHTWYCLTNR
jgi:hypothetical protein